MYNTVVGGPRQQGRVQSTPRERHVSRQGLSGLAEVYDVRERERVRNRISINASHGDRVTRELHSSLDHATNKTRKALFQFVLLLDIVLLHFARANRKRGRIHVGSSTNEERVTHS